MTVHLEQKYTHFAQAKTIPQKEKNNYKYGITI